MSSFFKSASQMLGPTTASAESSTSEIFVAAREDDSMGHDCCDPFAPSSIPRALAEPKGFIGHVVKIGQLNAKQRWIAYDALGQVPGARALALRGDVLTLEGKAKHPSLVVLSDTKGHVRLRLRSASIARGTFAKYRRLLDPVTLQPAGGIKEYRLPERRSRDYARLAVRKQARQARIDQAYAELICRVHDPLGLRCAQRAVEEARKSTREMKIGTKNTDVATIHAENNILESIHSSLQPSFEYVLDGRISEEVRDMAGESLALAEGSFFMDGQERTAVVLSILQQISAQLMNVGNIVHRDIKPENILFEENGDFVLNDWGFSVNLRQGIPRREILGTLCFISPEIVAGYGFDQKTDVFSLGVTVAVLALKRHLFSEMTRQHLSDFYTTAPRDPNRQVLLDIHYKDDEGASCELKHLRDCFSQWHAVQPEISSYVVNHMLCSDPQERADMRAVNAFAQSRQPVASGGRELANAVVARLAAKSRRHEDFSILRAYARAFVPLVS